MVTNKYVFDMSSGLIKIVKRNEKYYTYRLREIQESYNLYRGDQKYKFVWEKSASEVHNYKPYDDSDVTSSPEVYISDVRRWHPYKVRIVI